MSVIGALFVGTQPARVQAGKIFRQLNKVVLATVTRLSGCRLIKTVGKRSCEEKSGGSSGHENSNHRAAIRPYVWGGLFLLHSAECQNPVYMAIFFSFHGTVVAVRP